MSKQRAKACTPQSATEFYDILENKLKQLDIINRPECILNCDESGYLGTFGQKKFFTRKGEKNPHIMAADNEKLMYTVHVGCFKLK